MHVCIDTGGGGVRLHMYHTNASVYVPRILLTNTYKWYVHAYTSMHLYVPAMVKPFQQS